MAKIRAGEVSRHFGVLFNRIAMYPPQHPSFQKTIEEFYQYLKQISSLASSLDIYATPQSIIVNGEEIKHERGFFLGLYLHRRRIESLHINLRGISKEEIRILASILASAPREIWKEGGAKRMLENQRVRNAKIEEIDYQRYLDSEGETIEAFWDFFSQEVRKESRDSINVSREEIEYLLEKEDFLEKKLSGIKTSSLSSLLDKVKSYLQQKYPDKTGKFLQIALKVFLGRNFDKKENLEWNKIAKLLQDISSADLEASFFDFISTDKSFNIDILRKIAFLTEQNPSWKLSPQGEKKLRQMDTRRLHALQEAAQQLMQETATDRFISASYRRFLDSLTTFLDKIVPKYHYEVRLQEIEEEYLYMILDMLFLEPNISPWLAEELKRELVVMVERKDIEGLANLWETLSSLRSHKETEGENMVNYVCAALREELDNLLSLAGKSQRAEIVISGILQNMEGGIERLWDRLMHHPQLIYKRIYKVFLALSSPLVIAQRTQQLLANKDNIFLVKEYLNFLAQLPLEKNKNALLWIADFYRRREFVLAQAIEILAEKGLADSSFFARFVLNKYLPVREAALRGLLKTDKAAAKKYLRELILPFNIFGLRNSFIRENISIVKKNHIEEATDILREFVQRGRVFSLFKAGLIKQATNALKNIEEEALSHAGK